MWPGESREEGYGILSRTAPHLHIPLTVQTPFYITPAISSLEIDPRSGMWGLIPFRYYWPLITPHILLLWAGDCWNEELSDVFSWQDDWIIKCMPWEQLIASPGPGSRWMVVGVSQSTNLRESRAENREFHFPVIRQNKPRVLPRPRKSFHPPAVAIGL